GRQRALGASFRKLSVRSLKRASAPGSISGFPKSTARPIQNPDRSGFPFGKRGVGPEGGSDALLLALAISVARSVSPAVPRLIPKSASPKRKSTFNVCPAATAVSLFLKPSTPIDTSYLPTGNPANV